MDKHYDLVIVSAFGRGNWISRELTSRGHKVALVDVSQQLGRWSPEDWEGPFGVFESSRLTPTQRSRLVEDQEILFSDRGFVVWLDQGPLEMKSALSPFLLESWKISAEVQAYLSEVAPAGERLGLKKLRFKDSWLAHLAVEIYSTSYNDRHEHRWENPLPLLSPFFLRRPSRVGFEKSLQAVQESGAHVFPSAQVVDTQFVGRKLEALEVGGESSGVIKGHQFLWMLTSEETFALSRPIASQLFPKAILHPMWFWARFRVGLSKGLESSALPLHFLLIESREQPWTHENAVIGVQTAHRDQYDFWMRLPYHRRFQRLYLEECRDRLMTLLAKRLPTSELEVLEMPAEYLYDSFDLGAPRFPVYRAEDKENFRGIKLQNLHFDGPETWNRLDWLARFESQSRLLQKIEDFERQRKKTGGTSDQTLHT